MSTSSKNPGSSSSSSSSNSSTPYRPHSSGQGGHHSSGSQFSGPQASGPQGSGSTGGTGSHGGTPGGGSPAPGGYSGGPRGPGGGRGPMGQGGGPRPFGGRDNRDRDRRNFNQPQEAHRINHKIHAREIRLIDENNEQAGIVTVSEALRRAETAGLDLVEVAPQAKPPVCKIMDYGKFKYQEQKKEAEARKKRSEVVIKELRIRYRTDKGDLDTKLKHAREFLSEGDKVKFSMKFKGREVMYVDLGQEMFNIIVQNLADVATVDERSPLTGKQLYMVLAPLKAVKAEK